MGSRRKGLFSESLGDVKAIPEYNPEKLDTHEVVEVFSVKGSAEGFRCLRDQILQHFDSLRRSVGMPAVVSMLIACDKHATFSDVAGVRAKDKADLRMFDQLQDYLSGKAPEFRAVPRMEDSDDETLGLSEETAAVSGERTEGPTEAPSGSA